MVKKIGIQPTIANGRLSLSTIPYREFSEYEEMWFCCHFAIVGLFFETYVNIIKARWLSERKIPSALVTPCFCAVAMKEQI